MDIGTLTGHIDVEDELTSKVTSMTSTVWKFAEEVEGAFGAAAIAIGAVTGAVIAVGAGIVALGEKGSVIAGVETAFDHLAEAAGTTGDALREGLSKGVEGTIGGMELMQSTSRLLSSGMKLTAADTVVMGEAARAMGKATGTDAAGGLSTLSSALLTGRTRGLAMAGIIVDLKTAEKDYAASLGITVPLLDREQKLHADRIAILGATQAYVDRLGVSQLSLKERIQQADVAIEEWFQSLEVAVATSPHVSNAFDQIQLAIQKAFGGSSQSLLDTVVGWVNKFADAVATYGPIAIQWMGNIKDWIVKIYTEVQTAWDLVPDWFKNIARDAGVAGLAVAATGFAFKSASSSWQDSMSIGANLAQMTGQTIPGALKGMYEVVISLPEGFATARAAIEAFTERTALARLATMALTSQLGVGLVVGASAIAVVTAGYQAWQLWTEHAERAAAAVKQQTTDAANLERLNKALGTSFTDIDKAQQAWVEHAKTHPPVIAALTAAEERNAAILKIHKDAVDKLDQAFAAIVGKVDATSESFAKANVAARLSTEGQKFWIPLLDAHIAKNIALTDSEKSYYDVVTTSRLNQLAASEALLKANGVTLDRINYLKTLGMSEAEIAVKLGVTIDAYKKYEGELNVLKKIQQDTTDLQMKMSSTATDYAIFQHQREYQDAVKNLDKTSAAYATTMNALAVLRNAKDAAEGSSWSSLASKSKEALQQMADAYEADLERMLTSGLHFTHDQIQEQIDKTREAQAAARGMGDAYVSAADRAAAATEKQNQELIRTKALADAAAAAQNRALGNSEDVTSQNFQQKLEQVITNGGFNPTGQGSNIDVSRAYRLAAQGYSFEEILAIFAREKSGATGPVPPPRGPAIPGFAGTAPPSGRGGGGAPAVASSGGDIFGGGPIAGGGGGGIVPPNVSLQFNVNGTAQETAKQIKKIIIDDLKLSRYFPSA